MTTPRNHARVGLLLLAAGSSTRMGDNKMLLRLDGETVLRRAAGKAIAGGLDPVVVVTGHQREQAEAEVHDIDCATVFNPDYETGIHTSVRAGVDALPDDVDAAVVMLADMPFVTVAMLRELVAQYRDSQAPLVISRYGGEVNAPPMLYDRSLFGELRVMQARCGREVVKRHRDEALVMEWSRGVLVDIDTPEDYARVRSTSERHERGGDASGEFESRDEG